MSLVDTFVNENLDARAARRLARLLNPAPAFLAHLPGSPDRPAVERYIAEQFRAVHAATIHDFMPVLLTMGCHGNIAAATGVRAAAQPLFLEQYLAQPVESALRPLAGRAVERRRVAEIGNLVATQEWGSDVRDELETRLGLQARYRYSPAFEPAIEVYSGEDTRGMGPVALGMVRLGGKRQLRGEAGAIFGVDSKSPDTTLRFLLEFEF
jgi:hypothetical protein